MLMIFDIVTHMKCGNCPFSSRSLFLHWFSTEAAQNFIYKTTFNSVMFNRVKGTRDFTPQEFLVQRRVFDSFRSVAQRYNFREVEVPALENMDLLTAKSGEEIKTQIFTLDKRSKEELGMRFEFTGGLARMFISIQKEVPKPVKWFSIGRVWRYEQPQAGRMREFYQYNCEVYGSPKPECDAELINLAVDSLLALGLKKTDFKVRVNNRKLLQGILEELVPKGRIDDAMRVIDKRSKISDKDFRKELEFMGDKVDLLIDNLDSGFEALEGLNSMAQEGYDELAQVLSYLDQKVVKFDLGTARGLAYYTGTVFEIYDTEGKYRALCGGGRYDNMISVFGGQETPASGFAMGYSTVSLLLEEKKLLPDKIVGPDYYIAVIEGVRDEAIKVIKRLRCKYSVDYDLNCRNLGNQMKYANNIKAQKLIVLGPEEAASGMVKVKDMKSGKEKKVSLKDL